MTTRLVLIMIAFDTQKKKKKKRRNSLKREPMTNQMRVAFDLCAFREESFDFVRLASYWTLK